MLPAEYANFIRYVRQLCPELEQVVLSAHCHDDLGLAVANSLAALDAGVQQLECTVNGIGERAGNASLEEIVMAMRVRGDALQAHTDIDLSQIGPASRLVERLTNYPVPPNKAIVGANAFAHEAGIHQDGLLKDVATYQIIDPGELGLAMTLPLGKHSGRHAFSRACAEAGLDLDEDELVVAFASFKARADAGRRRLNPRALPGGDVVVTAYSIACLAGDGIGPEVMAQASRGCGQRRACTAWSSTRSTFRSARTRRCGSDSRSRSRRATPRSPRMRFSPRRSTRRSCTRLKASSTYGPP